jgi:hypothetical protein
MMRAMRATAGVTITLLLFTAVGCDEKLSDFTGPTPNLTPTFSSIQRDIFSATDSTGRLACSQCHTDQGGRIPPAGMVLTEGRAYDFLVGRPSAFKPGAIRVIPGDPDNSYLVQKLEGAPGIVGLRMPLNTAGRYLTPGQIAVIRRWIELGARND